MRKKLISLILITIFTFSQVFPLSAYATIDESESPRVPFVAKDITLGVPTTGQMSSTNTYEWYKINLASDGRLELGLKGPLKTKGNIKLYDGNGVREISNKYVESINEGKIDAYLIAGTYYIKVERVDNDWSYTLNNTFTQTIASEVEPNDIYQEATSIGTTDSKSGHLGYYKEDYTDNTDYWVIDVKEEGKQKISMEAFNGLRGEIVLYDKSKRNIASSKIGYKSTTNSTIEKYLAPGIYYIGFFRDGSFNPGKYNINTELTKRNIQNDTEPNDILEQSTQIQIGKTYTGNLGAYGKNTIDTLDWYKFNLAQDGNVTFNINGEGDVSGKIALFKSDGQDIQKEFVLGKEGIKQGSITMPLKAGSYYFRVETYDSKTWSYTFSSSYGQAIVNEDRPWESSQTITLNGSVSGRIDKLNVEDWYSVTTNGNGTLNLKMTTEGSSPGSYVKVYDIEGLREINSTWIDNGSTSYDIAKIHLRPGKYYVKIQKYYDREYNYTLSNTLTPADYKTDIETNDNYTSANSIDIGTTITGNIGYYSEKRNDDYDWYKVEMPANGLLKLKIETLMVQGNAPGSYLKIYNSDDFGSEIMSQWLDDGKEYSYQVHLAKGTYYIKLQRYYDRVYSYKMTTNIEKASLENDEILEGNNDIFENANVLPLDGSKTGHLGYYTNGYTDEFDWYKVTNNQDGNLTIKFNCEMAKGNTPGSYMKLYDVDGTGEIQSLWIDSLETGTISANLKPGTYYVKLQRYYDRAYSYTISSEFTKAPLLKDTELNDIPEFAKDISLNSLITGHLGYYSDRKTDTDDYYKIANTQKGSLTLNFVGNIQPGAYVKLFDGEMKEKDSLWIDSYEQQSKTFDNLEPGNYYILAQRYYGRTFSYILSNTFETGMESRPNVVDTYPRNLGRITQESFKAGLGTPVFAQFNKQIDVATINTDNFYIKDQNGAKIIGTPTISGTMAYFVPDFPLEINKTYTAHISGNVKDKAGNTAGQDYSWTFTVSETESSGEISKVTGVNLDKESLKLVAGDTSELVATVLPSNATNKAVEWTSSNKSVATVENGKVKAIGKGTVYIKVTTTDGGYSDTCEIVVTDVDQPIHETIWNNGNIYAVQNNPVNPTNIVLDKDSFISKITNYHYFNFGTLPGTISLIGPDGKIYGPWQASGRVGQGNVPNAYWDVEPNITLKAGTYKVIDSDPGTWSHNSQSNYSGFTEVKGYSQSVDEYVSWNNGEVQIVPSNKEWKVTFNSPVDITSAEQNITIKEKETGKVFSEISMFYDDSTHKRLVLKHTTAGFTEGKTYILYINKEIKTLDGTKNLKNGYKLEFKVQ